MRVGGRKLGRESVLPPSTATVSGGTSWSTGPSVTLYLQFYVTFDQKALDFPRLTGHRLRPGLPFMWALLVLRGDENV